MKASELMLGNLVLYRGITHRIIAIEVDGMVKIATPEKEEEYRRATWPDCIEPVPLTPEILEKNGFIRDGESLWYQDFRIVLSTSNGVSLVCGRQMRFRYAHQLQQALQLCGIEKEITI